MIGIDQVLEAAAEAVRRSESGELARGWRVRIWDVMNREYPHDALYRRAVLAYFVATRTLPMWDRIEQQLPPRFRGLPRQVLDTCRDVIRQLIPIDGTDELASYDVESV